MKIFIGAILMLLALATGSFAEGYEELLTQANRHYESGNKEAAKDLYLKAACIRAGKRVAKE
jgi:hypothetical protein